MKTSITFWIPASLAPDRLKNELSIALWASVTAIADISIEESKEVYTQICKTLQQKLRKPSSSILIATEMLSRVYNLKSKAKYDEQWLNHFNCHSSFTSNKNRSHGLFFYHDDSASGTDSIKSKPYYPYICTEQHEFVTIELESFIKLSVKGATPESGSKPKLLKIQGEKRANFIAPLSSNEYKELVRGIIRTYPQANNGQLMLWGQRLGRKEVNNSYIRNLKAKQKASTRKDVTPFITRFYAGEGDISIYLQKNTYRISSSAILLLKSDKSSLKALASNYNTGKLIELKLAETETGYEYTYGTHKFRLLMRSNQKTSLPNSITLKKSYE